MHVFMKKVYSFMGLRLFTIAVTSYLFYNNDALTSMVYNISEVGGSAVRSFNWLGSFFFLAPRYILRIVR